jgi:periplasmic protein TonB
MEKALKWYSPQAKTGSMSLAFLVHGVIYAGLLLYLAVGGNPPAVVEEQMQSIDYETFSAPPAPTPVVKHIARVEQPETPAETTPQPSLHPQELHDANGPAAGTQAEAKPVAAQSSEGTGDAADTPFYKIKPKYPRAALVAGVEGFILMKVDINEQGVVENVRVVGGTQRNMFQDEARRAVEKWKYKPYLDASGKPVKKTDHEVRVDFKLQDA